MPLRLLCLLAVALLLPACATKGPMFAPHQAISDNKAVVYIYRGGEFAFGGRKSEIFVDDILAARLRMSGFFVLELEPGRHTFAQRWKYWIGDSSGLKEKLTLEVDLQPGGIYFFRQLVMVNVTSQLWRFEWQFEAVPAELALPEIEKAREQGCVPLPATASIICRSVPKPGFRWDPMTGFLGNFFD